MKNLCAKKICKNLTINGFLQKIQKFITSFEYLLQQFKIKSETSTHIFKETKEPNIFDFYVVQI